MNFTNPSKISFIMILTENSSQAITLFASSFHVKDRLLKTTFRHASICLSKYGHCLLNSFEPNKMEKHGGLHSRNK